MTAFSIAPLGASSTAAGDSEPFPPGVKRDVASTHAMASPSCLGRGACMLKALGVLLPMAREALEGSTAGLLATKAPLLADE